MDLRTLPLFAVLIASPWSARAQEATAGPWGGFHAGVLLGPCLGSGNTTVANGTDDRSQVFWNPAFDNGRLRTEYTRLMVGPVFGVQGGYDRRMGNFVVGGSLALMRSAAKAEEHHLLSGTSLWSSVSEEREQRLTFLALMRARAGVVIKTHWLAYGGPGLSFGAVRYEYDMDSPGSSDYHDVDEGRVAVGWNLSVGLERHIWKQLSAHVEYAFNGMGKRTYATEASGRSANLDTHFDVTFRDHYHTVLLGARWYFPM
ncbi:MAG: outer membrane beta-barrel protein [Flavobacteriales bacterium]|nr:hypothetical protein [Flavobacteriales bacterium]MCC6576567.1 outer membrane beta-barrel protein [Flavobacteriales bacterium]NUQ15687.1 outer membrane beta-barrel protein [Flavobacteriales bacterium]